MAKRRGRILGAVSRSFEAILLPVSSHFANDLHAVPCRTVSVCSIADSRNLGGVPSDVSVPPLRVSQMLTCFKLKLQCFSKFHGDDEWASRRQLAAADGQLR